MIVVPDAPDYAARAAARRQHRDRERALRRRLSDIWDEPQHAAEKTRLLLHFNAAALADFPRRLAVEERSKAARAEAAARRARKRETIAAQEALAANYRAAAAEADAWADSQPANPRYMKWTA